MIYVYFKINIIDLEIRTYVYISMIFYNSTHSLDMDAQLWTNTLFTQVCFSTFPASTKRLHRPLNKIMVRLMYCKANMFGVASPKV